MKGLDVTRYTALASLLLCTAAVHGASVACRNPADGRAWSVVMDASAPIAWPWSEGAVSATVTVSNVVSGAKTSAVVSRDASPDGSFDIPAGAELIDVMIEENGAEAVINTLTARLKVGSDSAVYADKADRGFTMLAAPRVYSWSSLWTNETSSASSASLSASVRNGPAIGSWSLPGVGGYDVLAPNRPFGSRFGWVTASLALDGTTYWTGDFRLAGFGIEIIFR